MTSPSYILRYPRFETQCFICKCTEKDPVYLGELMSDGDITVHYYCVLLSTFNVQKGEDDQGFLGFLSRDIKNCEKKIRKKKCCYCNQTSANIKCQGRGCKRDFHLACGIANGAICTFVDQFDSFCNLHTPYPSIHPKNEVSCSICQEKVILSGHKDVSVIQAPCCKSGYFHRRCLARFAIAAGYYLKCPLCNNNELFRKELPLRGVFIPDQDASWETDSNAFEDLSCRPTRCVFCSRHQESAETFFVYCNACGSQGIHRECLGIDLTTFTCKDCQIVLDKLERKKHLTIVPANNPSTQEVVAVEDSTSTIMTNEEFSSMSDEDVPIVMSEDEYLSNLMTEDEDAPDEITEEASYINTNYVDNFSIQAHRNKRYCRCTNDTIRQRKRRNRQGEPYKCQYASETHLYSSLKSCNSDFINYIYNRRRKHCVKKTWSTQ